MNYVIIMALTQLNGFRKFMIIRAKGIKRGQTIILTESLSLPDQEVEIMVIPISDPGSEPLTKNTLADFVGKLQNSPNFQDDPVVIQRQMRDEWD
ncbi:hypothetical protein [Limnospira platensis]|nr:hypothetical protein SPLC1_S201640 [Arthrospira platensis C1]UWU45757.1 hypothetical protein APLC1_0441 [Arthrospira platensis C1]UWU45767.1 hypothetical protein APLC1_0451 [Arthrospira platensis C1]